MKVVFLDIDGVMNSTVFHHKNHNKLSSRLKRFYYSFKSKIKWIFNGFKYKYTSLEDYKIPASRYKYQHQFKRLQK